MTTGSPDQFALYRVLGRLGWALASRGPWARLRGLALCSGTTLLAVALGAVVLAGSYSDLRQQRADSIRPHFVAGSAQAQLLYSFDGFADVDDRPVTVISIWPLNDSAPLPPGVGVWPQPGEAVLSPALREDLGNRADVFGNVAGQIAPSGLEMPRERRVYVRPSLAAFSAKSMMPASGFGHGSNEGSSYGVGVLYSAPGWQVIGLLLAALVAPALVAIGLATSLDGEAREHRTRLLTTLGAAWPHRILVDVTEALPAVLAGSILSAAALGVMTALDIPLPALDAQLTADAAQRVIPQLIGAVIVAAALTLLTIIAVRSRPRLRRQHSAVETRQPLPWTRAAIFFASVMATIWITGQSQDAVTRTLVYVAGATVVAITLPAVVSVLLATIGELAGNWGLARGSAGTLLGGRRLQRFPRRTARLALGVCVAVLTIGQVQLWASQLGAQYHDAVSARTRMGTTVAAASHTTYGPQMATFLDHLPGAAQPVWISIEPPPVDHPEGKTITRISASCTSLQTLGIACSSPALPPVPNQQLSQLLRFGPNVGNVQVSVSKRPDLPTLERAGATLVLVSPSVGGLPLDLVQRQAYRELPGGLQLSTLGQGWVTAGANLLIRAGWTVLLGSIGVFVIALAAACALAGDVIASSRDLRQHAVLSGRTRWLYALTAWRTAVPLALAGGLGALVYFVLPAGLSRGEVYMNPSGTLAGGALLGSVVSGLGAALWAARRLAR